jgi:CHAD domain-containing protein
MTRGGERVPGTEDRIEAEWQFDANDLAPVESWLAAYHGPAELRVEREAPVEHLDTYYDTADWRVHRAGYALRLRRRNVAAELTLKSLSSQSAVLAARRELTEMLAPSEDLMADHAVGAVRERVRALRGRTALIPLFSAITRRQIYGLWAADVRAGEVALDHTTFIGETFDDQSQLLRVEIESVNGETDVLEPFVAALQADVSLTAANESKYETGLVRNHLTPIGPPSLEGRTFERDASISEVAYATLWRQLVALLQNEPGARLGDDIEALHDMRVAVRRLRAALSLFKPFLAPEILAQGNDLRWLARTLGEVRDLDVRLVALDGWSNRLESADAASLEPLLDEVRRQRSAARERMLSALDSARYERFVASFTELLAHPIDATQTIAALDVAPDLILRRQHRFARKAERAGRKATPEAIHDVRLEAKRMRYALEFFRPLYGRGVAAYIRRLVEVQDLLGAHQDAIVAADQLRELAGVANALPGPTLFVMGRIAERSLVEARELRSEFPKTYRVLAGKPLARLRKELRAGSRVARTRLETKPTRMPDEVKN